MSIVKGLAFAGCLCLSASPIYVLAARLPEGTDVRLQVTEKVSSATATEGQRFNLVLDEDIQVNGVVVVHRGAKAVGTVVSSHKRGHMGKAGDLNVLVNYLIVGDQRIPLRASSGREGDGRVGSTVVLTVLFGPLGLLKRGKDVELNPGVVLTAQVDQTTELEDTMLGQLSSQPLSRSTRSNESIQTDPVRPEPVRVANGNFTGNQNRVSSPNAAGPAKWLCEYSIRNQTFWKEAFGSCPQEMPAP